MRTVDIYIDSKKINNFEDDFFKTVLSFKEKSREWAETKGYNRYILRPTVKWTTGEIIILDYTLEVLECPRD